VSADTVTSDHWLSKMAIWAVALWIGQFIGALYSATVANLVFGISLGSVVDVLLCLQLFLPVVFLAFYLAVSAFVQDFSDWLDFIATFVGYLLTPFAASVGYTLYAYFAGAHLMKLSFVYAGLMNDVQTSLHFIAHLGTQLAIPHMAFIGSQQFFNWSQFVFAGMGLMLSLSNLAIQRWRAAR
jgi:hypothetical protein